MFLPRNDPHRNHIRDRPLEFGDPLQIRAIEEHDAQMRGEFSIGNIE